MCLRKSIRAHSRPHSIWRGRPRQRIRHSSKMPSWISSATRRVAPSRIPSSKSTPKPRWCHQLVATVQADQANIEAAQTQLDYTTIKAPLSGRAGLRLVDQGNIVHAATTTGLWSSPNSSPSMCNSRCRRTSCRKFCRRCARQRHRFEVVVQGRDDQQQLGSRDTFLRRQPDRTVNRKRAPEGDLSEQRTTACGRGNTSTCSYFSRPCRKS